MSEITEKQDLSVEENEFNENEEIDSSIVDRYENPSDEEDEEKNNNLYSLLDYSDEELKGISLSQGGKNQFVPDSYTLFLKEIGQQDLLTIDEEYKVAMRAKNGDELAKKEMIEKNLRLVVSIAKRIKSENLPLEDRVQEGSIGLMRAIETYDPELGYKFSTYATWWIKQAITRAVCNNDTIRIPIHAKESFFKWSAWRYKFLNENNREPNENEVKLFCKSNGISFDILKSTITVSSIGSLNVRLNNDDDRDDSELQDFIAYSGEYNDVEKEVINGKMSEAVYNAISQVCTKREIYILFKRFGLGNEDPHTLEEVGKELNITRERVRQIEAKALRKLKSSYKVKGSLKEFWKGMV